MRDAPRPKLKHDITPARVQRLKDEHWFLMNLERPAVTTIVARVASNGDRSKHPDYLYSALPTAQWCLWDKFRDGFLSSSGCAAE